MLGALVSSRVVPRECCDLARDPGGGAFPNNALGVDLRRVFVGRDLAAGHRCRLQFNGFWRGVLTMRKSVRVLLAAVVCWGVLVSVSVGDDPPTAAERARQDFELMRLLAEAYEQVDTQYVREVDRRKLVDAAIRGMLKELDPYSTWIAPEELGRFEQYLEQEFVGVGIQVQSVGGRLEIVTVLRESPAWRAGVRQSDLLIEVNGTQVSMLSPAEVSKLITGPLGRSVTLGVLHPGQEDVQRLDVVREKIQMPTVTGVSRTDAGWKWLLDGARPIAYVRMSHFSRVTTGEFREALRQIAELKPVALLVDLRANPGGMMDTAIEVADMFLESGRIVSVNGRAVKERVWEAKSGVEVPSDLPVAILLDRQSASASEVLSAALQDRERAIVMGERSFGKGSVQTVIRMENGRSAMKLTTAGYLRPSGVNIHRYPELKPEDAWGVTPTEGHVVSQTDEQFAAWLKQRDQQDGLVPSGDLAAVLSADAVLRHAVEWANGLQAAVK